MITTISIDLYNELLDSSVGQEVPNTNASMQEVILAGGRKLYVSSSTTGLEIDFGVFEVVSDLVGSYILIRSPGSIGGASKEMERVVSINSLPIGIGIPNIISTTSGSPNYQFVRVLTNLNGTSFQEVSLIG
jgi:hypothetical protein